MIKPKPVVPSAVADRLNKVAPRVGEPSNVSTDVGALRNEAAKYRRTRGPVIPSEFPMMRYTK